MKNSEASEFFFSTSLFSTSSLTFEKKQTLSFVLQAPARSAKGKPLLSMPAVAFSTMQGSLSTRSTVPLGRRGALLSLSPPAPRRRHRRVVAIKDDNQRRVLIPPSHAASTSYSQQQQHMGEEDITEAEKAAEAVAKAVRKKSLFSFFFAFRLASRVVRCVVVNAQKKNFEKLKTSKQLLQGIAPTAINMQAIATMFRFNEAEMAALIFWQHLAYLVTLPLYICG